MHNGSQWLVKLILPLPTLALSLMEKLRGQGHRLPLKATREWVLSSGITELNWSQKPLQWTAKRYSQPAGPGQGHAQFGVWVMQLVASKSRIAVAT